MPIVSITIPAIVLALLGVLIADFGARRLSAARRHFMLRIVLVFCSILPFLGPLFLLTPKIAIATVSARTVQASPAWTPIALLPNDDWRVRGTVLDRTPEDRRNQSNADAAWSVVNLLVVGLLSFAMLRGGARLRALRAGAVADGEFEGIRILRASDPRLAVPVTFGQTILLPCAASEWPEARRRAAILHEAAHVHRRDWGWLLAVRAANTFFWYNPGLWLLARALRVTAEEAADDAVLAAGMRPSEYARELLTASRALGSPEGFALAMVGRGSLRRRVRAVLSLRRDRRRPTRTFGFAAGTLLGGLAVLSASLTVRMPRLRLAPPAGTQAVPAGRLVRRGSTTVWVEAIHEVTVDRVVSWNAFGGASNAGLDPLHYSFGPRLPKSFLVFDIGVLRRDPHDTLTFRFPADFDGVVSGGPIRGDKAQVETRLKPSANGAFSTDMAVGVASGPWVPSHVIAPSAVGGSRETLTFPAPVSSDDVEIKTVVRLTNGRTAPIWSSTTFDNAGASICQITVRLGTDERVDRIETETRPYRWALFRDVPLVPGPAAMTHARRPILHRARFSDGFGYAVSGVR